MFKNKFFYIALIGLLLAVFWQELNQFYLKGSFPSQFGLITSQDEASYLRPPQNLLAIGEWKDSSNGVTSYFLRPPGYGLYFLSLKILFGHYVWIALKFSQILAYFLSIVLFFKTLLLFKFSLKSSYILTSFYATLPAFSGFIYFTISEGISPFVLLLTLYLWLKTVKVNENYIWYYLFSSAFLLLLRPQLIVFILLFSLYLLLKSKRLFYFSLISFLPFIFWNLRSTYINKGEWLGIHPVYSVTNNSLFRPPHQQLTELFKIWEYRSDIFHETISILSHDTTATTLNLALNNVPDKYRNNVKVIFKDFQVLENERQQLPQKTRIKSLLPGESIFISKTKTIYKTLKKKHKLDYHFITPMKSFVELTFNSHMNLFIFQDAFRGYFWCEMLRWTSFLMISLTICLSFISVFKKQSLESFLINLGLITTVIYLTYFQRLNEERYLTPILPLFLIISVGFIVNIKNGDKGNELEKSS